MQRPFFSDLIGSRLKSEEVTFRDYDRLGSIEAISVNMFYVTLRICLWYYVSGHVTSEKWLVRRAHELFFVERYYRIVFVIILNSEQQNFRPNH